jgi:succinate dehydrogenase / fumarate reductase flavoprotein subunit
VDNPEFKNASKAVQAGINRLLSIRGKRTVTSLHRELGKLLWEKCGMARNAAGLQEALKRIPELREEFWKNVNVTGEAGDLNQNLEYAGRVADFMEFAELLCLDALHRNESCGGHFREEFQTEEGEARRDDEHFSYVAAWEFKGLDQAPVLHKEPLVYDEVHMAQRSYK